MQDAMAEWTRNILKIFGDGGCIMLNFGCESVQNVLNDMVEGVTIQEMEDNFDLCKKYNVLQRNWIVGYRKT